MKKVSRVLLCVLLVITIAGCSSKSKLNYVSETLGIKIPQSSTITSKETDTGVQGDGTTIIKIELNEEDSTDLTDEIIKTGKWSELPLTENIQLVMYGGTKESVEYAYNYAQSTELPEVENGYWYFIDRSAEENTVSYDDAKLLERASFNFTLAIYDTDNKVMYFIEIDT